MRPHRRRRSRRHWSTHSEQRSHRLNSTMQSSSRKRPASFPRLMLSPRANSPFPRPIAKLTALDLDLKKVVMSNGITLRNVSHWFIESSAAVVGGRQHRPRGARSAVFSRLWEPVGAAKTTLLNIIAGLVTPSEGSVVHHDRGKRGVAAERVHWLHVGRATPSSRGGASGATSSFGLEARRTGKRERALRASAALELVGLTGHEAAFTPISCPKACVSEPIWRGFLVPDPQMFLP